MRTETRVHRVGELLGPIDWDYDFTSHDWNHGSSTNPEHVERCVARLRELAAGIARSERWDATTDGGIPRIGWGEVIGIGMYDGWPYWRPVPSVCIAGMYGGEWSCFASLSDIRQHDSRRTTHGE